MSYKNNSKKAVVEVVLIEAYEKIKSSQLLDRKTRLSELNQIDLVKANKAKGGSGWKINSDSAKIEIEYWENSWCLEIDLGFKADNGSSSSCITEAGKIEHGQTCGSGGCTFTAVASCTGGQVFDGVKCVCPAGQIFDGSNCIAIPICTGGKVLQGTTCVCPSGTHDTGSTCVTCQGGQVWNGSSCSCPSGQILIGSTCQCPGGKVLQGTTCVCPSGTHDTGSTCVTCKGGQTWDAGTKTCKCPAGQTLVGGTCQCPGGKVLQGTTCVCPSGTHDTGSTCVTCKGGQTWDAGTKTCKCPAGQTLVGGLCKCPAGQVWDAGTKTCKGKQFCPKDKINSCHVAGGHIHGSISGSCQGTGTCKYKCNNGKWDLLYNLCDSTNCKGSDISGCEVNTSSHNATSGYCATGYKGSCKYKCEKGYWKIISNACVKAKSCTSTTIGGCSLGGAFHNFTKGTCSSSSGYGGTCQYKCNEGKWEKIANSCVKQNLCSKRIIDNCHLAITLNGNSSGKCKYEYKGSCNYKCENEIWKKISNNCVKAKSCPKTTIGGCELNSSRHHSIGRHPEGYCISGYGVCQYRCNDGVWENLYNGCF